MSVQHMTSKKSAPRDVRAEFLADIEAFLKRYGMTPTAFGSRFARDDRFVFRLRGGSDPRASTITGIRERMKSYRGSAR